MSGTSQEGGRRKSDGRPHEKADTYALESTLYSYIKENQEALQGTGGQRLEVCCFHGAHGAGPRGKRNGNYRHGAQTKEAKNALRALTELIREAQNSFD